MSLRFLAVSLLVAALTSALPARQEKKADAPPLDVSPPPLAADRGVKYDYDIIYVRAARHGDKRPGRWADFSDPTRMEPGPT